MNDVALTPADNKAGMNALLGLNGIAPSAPAPTHDAEDDVSVAGVMLLSAMSVMMAILAMVMFALLVIGCWWALSHVPVPAFVHHGLVRLHLARG